MENLSEEKLKENLDFWNSKWESNKIPWHIEEVDKNIKKYVKLLTQGEENRKILIPLCGKSLDLIWLKLIGFKVFGIESSKKAIEELCNENNLDMTFNEEDSIFESNDGLLKIWVGDFFKCSHIIEKWGPFSACWDRGSFIAINYSFRTAYKNILEKCFAKDFRYLIQTINYDKELSKGPPNSVSEDDMKNYFGEWANFELLERNLIDSNNHLKRITNSLPVAYEEIYLITSK